MVNISKSTGKELKEFGEKEWSWANREHYGKDVDYKQSEFIFKATENGEIVGYIKGEFEGGVLSIYYLIVAHDKKVRGIGKLLVEEAETLGKEMGAHKIHLMTGLGWEAEKFYQKLGYEKVAILKKHNFKKDFVVYEKFI